LKVLIERKKIARRLPNDWMVPDTLWTGKK